MAWLSKEQLNNCGFSSVGNNVLISDKAYIYSYEKISIGDNTRIDDLCVISGKVTIGRNVHIAVFCNVAGGKKGVTLSDFSGLAAGVSVFSESDDYSGRTLTNPTVPDEFKSDKKSAVIIGKHCILGTRSIVFPGVVMADGCSLGAMSMLTKSTKEWGIYAGIPAKRIKNRKRDLLELEERYLNGSDE